MNKKSTAITVIVFGLICIVSAVLLFSKIANSPHSAPTITTSTAKDSLALLDMSPISISNSYVSFKYPKLLSTTKTSLVSGEVAAYTFMHRDIATWKMAVEVMPAAGETLTSNSAYEVRKDNPAEYQESTYTDNGQSVDVMTDTTYGGFSKVAFMTHGQYQATVSLYGDDTNGENALQQTFNMVLNSWRWHS